VTTHTLAGVLTQLRGEGRGSPELEERLNQAFPKHEARLHAHCSKELRGFPSEKVEEIVQEILLEAWNKLPTYRPESRFKAFLWTIAAYKCANARRKRQDSLSFDGILEPLSSEPSPLGQLTDRQRDELVETAARQVLDDKEQEVVYLRWVLDYPLEEIASLLGLPDSNAVRVTLQRCKRRMQDELSRLLAERGHGQSFLRGSSE
jgi:RNA polymerase sigma-70 factor (ECF subfamily)